MGAEIAEKFDNPLIFKDYTVGGKLGQPRPVHGHDVTLLIDICNAVAEAKRDGTLTSSQARFADRAAVLASSTMRLASWLRSSLLERLGMVIQR